MYQHRHDRHKAEHGSRGLGILEIAVTSLRVSSGRKPKCGSSEPQSLLSEFRGEVKLIQNAKLDARIDSEKSRVVMSKAPPSVYQQVGL